MEKTSCCKNNPSLYVGTELLRTVYTDFFALEGI